MKEALKLALKALEEADEIEFWNKQKQAITAIKEALAQPEQEPLKDEEIDRMYVNCKYGSIRELARAIEAAHGIGGEA